MKYHFLLTSLLIGLLFSCQDPQPPQSEENQEEETAKVYVKDAPEWSKNATIYEVNLRQFSEEGTIKAFQKELPRLKELGIDILWFMPIHPIGEKNRKGTDGSYYAVQDYKGLHADYGTMEDFKTMVKEAHDMGMYVIIDWVANHTAPDNVWVKADQMEWYDLDSLGKLQPPHGTDWWDVAQLNYENTEMRAAMIDALKFWVAECDIDGYRCDVADHVPTDFWNDARMALDSIKDVFMLAESENPEHHEKAFDMTYGWEFHFVMNEVAQGKKSVKRIREYLNGKAKEFPEGAYRLHFTSNHDENSWKGTVRERLGDATKTFAVLAATMEGMPLLYNGQEASLDKRLEFFEKDPIEWKDFSMTDFYKPLLKLNHENEALWNGSYGGDLQILSPESDTLGFAYLRKKGDDAVFCVFNFSKEKRTLEYDNAKLPEGMNALYVDEQLDPKKNSIELEAWGYRVYHKK